MSQNKKTKQNKTKNREKEIALNIANLFPVPNNAKFKNRRYMRTSVYRLVFHMAETDYPVIAVFMAYRISMRWKLSST